MKKRALFSLFAAFTAGSFLLLSGCGGIDLTKLNQEETTLSAEMEQENLSDGTLQFYSTWYNTDNTPLIGATITFSEDKNEIFTGTTSENGVLEACQLPGNTTLTCEIADATGAVLAKGDIVYKISEDYTALTVFPVHQDEKPVHVLELPTTKNSIRSALFLSEDKTFTIANTSPFYEGDEVATEKSESADNDGQTPIGDTVPDDGTAPADTTVPDDGTAPTDTTVPDDGTAQ